MIKYIVFDFDGTLADTFDIFEKVIKSEFPEISDQDFKLVKDQGIKNIMKKNNISPWQMSKMVLRVTSKIKAEKEIKLFPEINNFIENLGKNYQLGVLSSNSEENIKNNILKKFDFIYAQSSLSGKDKVLKKMCKKQGLKIDEVIYVGDEDRDVVAAKKIGMKCLAVTWGFNTKKRLQQVEPDYLAENLEEVSSFLA